MRARPDGRRLGSCVISGAEAGDHVDTDRIGDHVRWVESNEAFMADYPDWHPTPTIEEILVEIHGANIEQWERERSELEAAA